MKHPIPIENVYYLFSYAWDRFPEAKAIGVGTVDSPNVCDLFASVLVRGVKRLMRRGLDRGYAEAQADMAGVRGRIIIGDTLRRNLLMFGRANCRFDELSHDVLHNQIIKATMTRLLQVDELDYTLRRELSRLKRLLSGITDIALSNSTFRRVQLSRNNGNYDLLMKICELVNSRLLPHEDGNGYKFVDVLQDQQLMAGVFEAFVRNFFKAEQDEFRVKSETIYWDAFALNAVSAKYLPVMRTDVTLRSKRRTIVIDTKYYPEALTQNYGQKKIRSDHLYQLYAYMRNCKSQHGTPEGILLYPATSEALDLAFLIGGHSLRVKTLQLDQPWQIIHTELCELLTTSEPQNCIGGGGFTQNLKTSIHQPDLRFA